MQARQIIATVNSTFVTAATLGAKPPKALAAEHNELARLAEQADNFGAPVDLAEKVLDALARGADPIHDEAVRDAVVAQRLAGLGVALTDALGLRALTFIETNATEMLAVFAEPFDRAAATLAAAFEKLGDVDLTDAARVMLQGGDAAATWVEARQANADIEAVRDVWGALGVAYSPLAVQRRDRLHVIADIDPQAFVREQLAGADLDAWGVTRRGWTLSLATPTVLAARIAAIAAAQQQQAARAAAAHTAAVTAPYRMRAAS